MSLPAPYTLPAANPGNLALRAKQTLLALARTRYVGSPDTFGQAYNNLQDLVNQCPRIFTPPRSLDTNLNETAAHLWAEIERLYWEGRGLDPKDSGLGSEAVIAGLKGAG